VKIAIVLSQSRQGAKSPRKSFQVVRVLALASVVITSGCATALVRDSGERKHAFPATTVDAEFLWDCGVKGKPLFGTLDREKRSDAGTRVARSIGAIVDLPFSIATDTILLPFDLLRRKADPEKIEPNSIPSDPML
jgi:uncharacterized protein YceK